MILLYTGANAPNVAQINPEKSLGGFVSSSLVPNGRLGNLFSAISKTAVIEQREEIRMIALKNTTGNPITGLVIYTNNKNKSYFLKIAAVASGLNSKNELMFEQLMDGQSLPYQAELSQHEGNDNALDIGDIANDQVIGIWVQRELDITKYPELIKQENQNSPLTTDQLVAAMEAQSVEKEEEIELIIKWD